jgi:acyl-CoA dehydrogenase family protein 9
MDSVAKHLFTGTVVADGLHPYPKLTEDEREPVAFLLDSFRKYARDHIDPVKIEKAKGVPKEVIAALGEMGILGMTIPEAYGGFSFNPAQYGRVMEEMSRVCGSTTILVGAHQSIGYKGIVLAGSEEQKQKWLPLLATGERLAAFALTEPDAGSDASSVKTVARYVPEKKGYILNGTKQWITNGGIAHTITTLAKTGEESALTAFIISSDMPGFSIGKEEVKLGLKGSSTAQLIYENMFVPEENMLGRKGRGFLTFMEVLDTGRMGLASSCLGGCKEMIKQAYLFASVRRQFGSPVMNYEMIRHKFARMAAYTYASESMVYLSSGLVSRGLKDYATESCLCKFYITEVQWKVINDALQIAGGNGYMEEYPFERFLRDSRINLIFEGTNEITRMYGATTGLRGVAKLRGAAPAPDLSWAPAGLREECAKLSDLIQRFGERNKAFLDTHGAEHRNQEYELERIADIAAGLYACVATLSRTAAELPNRPDAELYAKAFLHFEIPRLEQMLGRDHSQADALRTELSSHLYAKEGYSFDRWDIV